MVKATFLLTLPVLILAAACGGDATAPTPTAVPIESTPAPTPAGPVARVEPAAGPPGVEVTVSGVGWPAGQAVAVGIDPPAGEPYATGLVAADGSFSLHFRLEQLPDGAELAVGALNLRVATADAAVRLRFAVQSPRPIFPTTPAG